MTSLRSRLITLQSLAELARKADKAKRYRGKLWTEEEIERAERWAEDVAKRLEWK